MRSTTWIAVLIGGGAGAAAALGRMPPPPVAPAPEMRPAAAAPVLPTPPQTVASATPALSAAVLPPPETARRPSPNEAPVPVTPAVSSREELTGYEVACQEHKEPAGCRAVAGAYEQGKVVSADPARAKRFRKIELTFLVSQCEEQLPAACRDLAYRYQRGEGVARNEENAQALLERARALCTGRRAVGCSALVP